MMAFQLPARSWGQSRRTLRSILVAELDSVAVFDESIDWERLAVSSSTATDAGKRFRVTAG
jgi:hypothetical protein